MYNEKLVATLKVNGKVLREKNGEVILPFNTEYSLLLKNLSSKKAVVGVQIDGEDVLDEKRLIINANSQIELEGFMKGMAAKNKFKFIEKTKQIEDFRGNRIDDSLVRIEFQFEKDQPIEREIVTTHTYRDYWYYPAYPYWHPYRGIRYLGCKLDWSANEDIVGYSGSRGTSGGMSVSSTENKSYGDNENCYSLNNVALDNINDGITVKGSEINQDFNYGYTGTLEEQSYTMILKLKGIKLNKKKVSEPIFVKDKLVCCTCGQKNSSLNKFCLNCGTFLR